MLLTLFERKKRFASIPRRQFAQFEVNELGALLDCGRCLVFVVPRSPSRRVPASPMAREARRAVHLKGILMPFSLKRLIAVGLAGSVLLAGGQAFAQAKKPAQAAPAQPAPAQPAPPAEQGQGQQPQGPIRVELSPGPNDWTKICGKDPGAGKEICYTTREFTTQPDQPPILAVAVYDVKGEDTRMVRFMMPVGLMLRPGFRFAVDKGAMLSGNFEICFPNGCFAESKVNGGTVDQMKKGTGLTVTVKNPVNNEVTFGIPLGGFGKAFDGPAVDPKVLEEQQKKLQEELQKRADDERKRLEAQPGTAQK